MFSTFLLCDSRQPLAPSGPLQQSSHLILIIWKSSISMLLMRKLRPRDRSKWPKVIEP